MALFLMVLVVMVASMAAPPSDARESGSGIHATARVRPSVGVVYEQGGEYGTLSVRSNTSWVLVTEEVLDSGARVKRLFSGSKTGDTPARIRLIGRLRRFDGASTVRQ